MTVCEENCLFIDYNKETNKAICSCYVKTNFPILSKINFDKEKLCNNFIKINNIGNFYVLKYYSLLFQNRNFIKIIPSYSILVIFIFSLISIFIFCFYDYPNIKKIINKIYHIKKTLLNSRNKISNAKKDNKTTIKFSKNKNKKMFNHFIESKKKKVNKNNINNNIKNKSIKCIKLKRKNNNPPKKSIKNNKFGNYILNKKKPKKNLFPK